MSNEAEATLNVRTKADIAELVAYTKALKDANAELREYIQLAAAADQVGAANPGSRSSSGGTGAHTGAPPPPPAARAGVIGNTGASLPNVAARPGGAPPPGPSPTAAPAGAPPAGPTAPATGGAPPPAPAPGTGGGAAPAPGPAGAPQAPAGAPPAPAAPAPAGGGGTGGGGGPGAWNPQAAGPGLTTPTTPAVIKYTGGKPMTFTSVGVAAAQGTYAASSSFLSHTASTAIGVGLGSSLFGLPLAAINRYMTLSTVLAQLDQRFREVSDGAEMFGTSMGYGIARSAQLAETLGNVQNTFSRDDATRMVGLARFTGADPSTVLRSLGRVGALQGRNASSTELAELLGAAKQTGMDQGRIEEFLQLVEQHSSAQFAATGRTSLGRTLGVMGLQTAVYGENDPRRANDSALLGGLNNVLTGSGPMRSYMMRAMGYGTDAGPGYIEMRKRLDAGVYDPRNILDLFGSFQARGMGEGAMFRAIESVAGGSLKAHQIEALVKTLGNEDGLARFKDSLGSEGAGDRLSSFLKTLDPKDLERFGAGGFTAVGASKVSAGEAYENRTEAAMMKVGGELAQAVPNIQDTLDSLGRALQTILGGDVGGQLERIAGGIERMAGFVERNAVPGSQGGFDWIGALPAPMEWRARRGIINSWGRVHSMYQNEGPLSATVEGVEAGLEFWGDQYYGEGETNIGGGLWDSAGVDLTRRKAGGGAR